MSKLEKLKDKAKALEAKDPKGAIEAWHEALKAQDEEGDPNPDLSIYNRIGDLYLKVKDPAQAADYYDRAVDKYAELGFHNNAIAMCNKVLRNAPARQGTYLKLAKLYAAKGFMAEAKQNFVEYAERMQRAGKIQHAFAALKEFTDISPESDNLREMLAEHLKMYGEDTGRRSSSSMGRPSGTTLPPIIKPAGAKRKTSSLVFLDLDAPAGGPAKAEPRGPVAPPPPAASILEEVTAEPDTSLEIETTSLADAPEAADENLLEGLETTGTDFGEVRRRSVQLPSIRDEEPSTDVEPMPELEPTAEPDLDEAMDLEPLVEEEPAPPPPPPARPAPVVKPRVGAPPPAPARSAPPAPPAPPKAPPPAAPKVQPVVPKRPTPKAAPPPPPPAAAPPKRKTVVEIPPLELEPDFETATTEGGHDVDDQPLAIDEGHSHPDWVRTEEDLSITEGGRKSTFIDLGVEGVTNQGDAASSLVFSNIEQSPAAPGIEELEGHVADNPDDPEAHHALGEALIEAGERERGVEELDIAVSGFEVLDNPRQAQDLVAEILRLEPNSVRHRQKTVELAFKAGDKGQLIEAYLELADTLLRTDLPEKARAVYERVVEHDKKNERAKAALAMLSPPPAEPAPDKKVKAKDAKMTVRADESADGDFVDLSAMMMDDDDHARDTRMKVEDEEPTGDEEQDFHDMLARFKQGIDENIDEADFQSHYDLGVAFKEMGLLDEAIAEFQKALRAPEGKLRTSEALGICFFEKGAHGVAESILRRGLELPAAGDQERLGVLYWLARSMEAQGKQVEARDLYGRVFAVEIRFLDVGERVRALAKAK
jgi:tetratricopeptide (TPR) repeat protein